MTKYWTGQTSRETVDQYAVEIQKLDNTVLSLLSENAGLKQDCFINMFGKMSQTMRMNYYPPCTRPDLVLGISPHSDATGLTVLLQDDETVISNGIYKSIEHRAVTNMDRDRISIATFCGPSMKTEVGPVPELIDELHPCLYRRFNRAEYMQNFFSGKLEGKKIDFAKIKS
ncbi:codeine O-demethylase isoform X3 [Cryptomeria japonica]|uniref:codeine O-demethylase isoform X3 n=1 Tax=Cryptomeria japonica TaxID=3369 RepID=UPI0027DA0AE6|nr:codeine O-demethylase isoform X3 [Cryptomeria japonica]